MWNACDWLGPPVEVPGLGLGKGQKIGTVMLDAVAGWLAEVILEDKECLWSVSVAVDGFGAMGRGCALDGTGVGAVDGTVGAV